MAITIVVGTVLSNSAAAVGSWDATVVRDLLKFIKKNRWINYKGSRWVHKPVWECLLDANPTVRTIDVQVRLHSIHESSGQQILIVILLVMNLNDYY